MLQHLHVGLTQKISQTCEVLIPRLSCPGRHTSLQGQKDIPQTTEIIHTLPSGYKLWERAAPVRIFALHLLTNDSIISNVLLLFNLSQQFI